MPSDISSVVKLSLNVKVFAPSSYVNVKLPVVCNKLATRSSTFSALKSNPLSVTYAWTLAFV